MELEGSRFIKKLPSYSKSYTLQREILKYLEIDENMINKDFEDLFEKDFVETAPPSLENIEDDLETMIPLSNNISFCLETEFFSGNSIEKRTHESHVITLKRFANTTIPRNSIKIALDENTRLTPIRKRIPKVAYNPEKISSMVLQSLDGLFGDINRSTRTNSLSKRVTSIFHLFWNLKSNSYNQNQNQNQQELQFVDESQMDPTDWLLLQLFYSVCGDSSDSCTIKWYTTCISPINNLQHSFDSRIVIVAFCIDKTGSIFRISGITSNKSCFHVSG